MKSLVIGLLVIVVLIQLLGKTLIVGHFVLNQDYIAQNLCEQREQKQNHCRGVCHLKKTLEGTDTYSSDSKTVVLNQHLLTDLFFETLTVPDFPSPSVPTTQNPIVAQGHTSFHPLQVERPPRA